MQAADLIRSMVTYNSWANNHILDHAERLSDDQLDAPTENGHHNLRQTIYHTLAVEWMWRMILETKGSPEWSGPPLGETPSMVQLRDHHAGEDEKLHAFVESLDGSSLEQPFTATDPGGNQHELIPWKVLTHMMYHSGQHRSEAAVILTQHGHSPGNVDFIFYG